MTRWPVIVVVCVALAFVATGMCGTTVVNGMSTGGAPGVAAIDFCSRVSPGTVAGAIGAPDLVELSGLAASHAHPGVLWANNDSGDAPRLFAMSEAGAPLGVFAVTGAEAIDWEDIATGPGPDPATSYVYIADIGDNAAARDHVTVYRVREPDSAPNGVDGSLEGAEAIQLQYPDGPEDAEALLVDPTTGDLFIITKQLSGQSRVLRAPMIDVPAATSVTMSQVGAIAVPATPQYDPTAAMALPTTMVTGADISPDGQTVLVRTYQQVLGFERAEGQAIGDALAGAPCSAPQVAEPQGEAIAFSATGDRYFIAGETQLAVAQGALAPTDPDPLASFAIAPRPTTTTTTAPASTAPLSTAPVSTAPVSTATAATAQTTAGPTLAARPPAESNSVVSSAPLPPGSSPPANRWWIWTAVAAAMIVLGAAAMVARRRRAPPPGE